MFAKKHGGPTLLKPSNEAAAAELLNCDKCALAPDSAAAYNGANADTADLGALMRSVDQLEIRVRRVSADAVDAIRPLARRVGFRSSVSDLVRFAVLLASEAASAADDMNVAELVGRAAAHRLREDLRKPTRRPFP